MKSEQNVGLAKLLLIHGLLSSPQEFGLITPGLRARRLSHEALSIQGYTLASDATAFDWRGWRSAAADIVDVQARGDAPVVLGGLCMGAILAAALALEAPGRVAGLVLMSPSFEFDGWGSSPIRHLRHIGYWTGLDRYFAMHEREPYGVKNERLRAWIAEELEDRARSAAGPARVPLRALREGERMLADVKSRLDQLKCPILMIHARDDEICSLRSVERVFEAMPQADKELVILENSYHMVTIDNDRQQLIKLIDHFVRRVSGKATAINSVASSSC